MTTDRTKNSAPVFDVDSAINECLDLEAGGRPDELRALIRRATTLDPAFEAKLLKARAVLGQLGTTPNGPDLTPEILTEVDYLRPFLSPRRRRQVSATRVAIAAAAVITLSFVMVMEHLYPQSGNAGPAPLGGVVRASGADAADSMKSLVSAVDEMRMGVSKPAPVGRPHKWNGPIWSGSDESLVMGDTSRYDTGTNWTTELGLGSTRREASLIGVRSMEYELDLAQTGWDGAPAMLSLTTASGLLQHPATTSITQRVAPGAAVLNLDDDLLLGPTWPRKPGTSKGSGLDRSAQNSANK